MAGDGWRAARGDTPYLHIVCLTCSACCLANASARSGWCSSCPCCGCCCGCCCCCPLSRSLAALLPEGESPSGAEPGTEVMVAAVSCKVACRPRPCGAHSSDRTGASSRQSVSRGAQQARTCRRLGRSGAGRDGRQIGREWPRAAMCCTASRPCAREQRRKLKWRGWGSANPPSEIGFLARARTCRVRRQRRLPATIATLIRRARSPGTGTRLAARAAGSNLAAVAGCVLCCASICSGAACLRHPAPAASTAIRVQSAITKPIYADVELQHGRKHASRGDRRARAWIEQNWGAAPAPKAPRAQPRRHAVP